MKQSEKILRYLTKCDPAISGQGGHSTTFRVACVLFNGFALSEIETLHYLRIYNQTCQPPWPESDLKHKAQQAANEKHSKPRGYLILSCKQPKPIRIISALKKATSQRLTVTKLSTSRTVRTIIFNSTRIGDQNSNNIYKDIEKNRPKRPNILPLASCAPPGLCSPCWYRAGKFIPLNNSGTCPICTWQVSYAA